MRRSQLHEQFQSDRLFGWPAPVDRAFANSSLGRDVLQPHIRKAAIDELRLERVEDCAMRSIAARSPQARPLALSLCHARYDTVRTE